MKRLAPSPRASRRYCLGAMWRVGRDRVPPFGSQSRRLLTGRRSPKQDPSPRLVRRYVRVLSRQERHLATKVAAEHLHLHRFEHSEYSQNGEDGILEEIFARIGPKDRSFIEIGASDGAENCTRALVESGWNGVWIEGDRAKSIAARRLIDTKPVAVVESFVDRESILSVLAEARASRASDLLVIDVDGNDYWIWEEVASRYRARVVVIEYNAVMGPRRRWVMPYNAAHQWDETYWHGAGLAALAALGSRLGYTLIGCDSHGVNAFFVLSSEAGPFQSHSARYHYVGPRYGLPFGHPCDAFESFETSFVPDDESTLIRLKLVPPRRTTVRPGGLVYVCATVENGTSIPIGASGSKPVHLASWWLHEDGRRLPAEQERSVQPWRANPRKTSHLVGRATAPSVPGRYTLVCGLVQETVRWFDEPNGAQVAGQWSVE